MSTTLYIDHRLARIGKDRGTLLLRLPDSPPRRIPLKGLDRLIINGSAEIDAAALNLLWEAKISLLCLTGRRGDAGARFHGGVHNDASLRLAQYRAWQDATTRIEMAQDLVRFRFRIMRNAARTMSSDRRSGSRLLEPAVIAIRAAEQTIASAHDLNTLRGIEGSVAAAWFAAYARLFPPSLGFTNRRRRPPPDPVNAALSLGYTIATSEAARAAVRAGLDPAIGLLHGLAHGREALALDLVEPARPLVDVFVHHLFHERLLEARNFTADDRGGVVLGKAGRRTFYEAWETQAAAGIRSITRLMAREGARRLRSFGCRSESFEGGPDYDVAF